MKKKKKTAFQEALTSVRYVPQRKMCTIEFKTRKNELDRKAKHKKGFEDYEKV